MRAKNRKRTTALSSVLMAAAVVLAPVAFSQTASAAPVPSQVSTTKAPSSAPSSPKDFQRGFRDGFKAGFRDGRNRCDDDDNRGGQRQFPHHEHVKKDPRRDYQQGFKSGFRSGFRSGQNAC
ncbi:hypothetical protein ACIPPM_24455 [Streptomyces sp. NPDC090119]|uniref:hypothetical protein n=1 Tax=Streptomyces sp. NPDC090119 TaxID=3365951 RepID=UPI0038086878